MATANAVFAGPPGEFYEEAGGTSSVVGSTAAKPVDDQKTSDTEWVKRWFNDKELPIHHTYGWRRGRVHPLETAGRYQGAETGGHSVV